MHPCRYNSDHKLHSFCLRSPPSFSQFVFNFCHRASNGLAHSIAFWASFCSAWDPNPSHPSLLGFFVRILMGKFSLCCLCPLLGFLFNNIVLTKKEKNLLNMHMNELLFCKLISNTIYIYVRLHMHKCDVKCNFCLPL